MITINDASVLLEILKQKKLESILVITDIHVDKNPVLLVSPEVFSEISNYIESNKTIFNKDKKQ